MKTLLFAFFLLSSTWIAPAYGQETLPAQPTPAAPDAQAASSTVDVNWLPPAMDQLTRQATSKSSFAMDRTLLAVASELLPKHETELRQSINKLDGIGVRVLHFGDAATLDEDAVNSLRSAYHRRGWKHVVTTTNANSPLHSETTDLWLAVEGSNLRGAVILVEGGKNLTLVTISGNLSPLDLLHLRGHFGIPNFEGRKLENGTVQ